MPGESPTDPTATRTAAARTSAGGNASETLADAERIEAATTVGRFTILQVVGAGGMGQVYAAYDPQLDRRVALKLLHTPDDEIAKRRLVREAQALARLSHPNVVGVHEVGSHEGRVFVAMEFVEGETLKAWAHANPPGEPDRQRRALELLIHAARGLAAAHETGLVHRDVKPGNILVGRDGRVRVADFGLARADEEAQAPAEALEASLSSSQSEGALVGAALTRTGMIAGTPAYMAPEQLTSEPVSAASDQFGFCVTAWEVLYGRRPFELGAIVALLQAILDGRVDRPQGVDVPDAVEAALRKGLQYRPKRRHRSMNALVGALENELRRLEGLPVRSRNGPRWATGIALAGVAGVAAALAVWSLRSDGPSCRADPSSLAGVWDDARKLSIESAILETKAGFASDTWSRIAPAIDDWRDSWLAARTEACEATHVRGEQSAELLDLRMACLEDRRMHMQAFLDVLAEGSVDTIADAHHAFADLPSIARCGDARYVRENVGAPTDPISDARAAAVSAQVARAAALQRAGRPEAALAHAVTAVEEAEDLGYERQLAQAHFGMGSLLHHSRQYEKARAQLETAYLHARRAGAPELATGCSRELALINGIGLFRFTEAKWWLRLARLEDERVSDPIDAVRIELAEADLLRTEGRLSEAADEYRNVLSQLRATADGERHPMLPPALRAYGEVELVRGQASDGCRDIAAARALQAELLGEGHPSMASFHLSSEMCNRLRGELEASAVDAELALALTESTFGPDHISLTASLNALAGILTERGDLEGAIDMLDRAIALRVPQPQDPVTTSNLLSHQGSILLDMQQWQRAAEVYRRAFDLSRSALGDHHPQTARARIDLGAALDALGEEDEAIAWIQAGLAVDEAILGSEHPDVALVHDVVAGAMTRRGDLDAALDHAQRAFDIFLRAYGPDSHAMLKPHVNLCSILSGNDQSAEALPHCERALELARRVKGTDPAVVATLHNNFGMALFAAGEMDEALRHYSKALDGWRTALGETDLRVAFAIANIAEVQLARGEHRKALAGYLRSVSLRESIVGAEHPALVVPLVGAARAQLELGDRVGALANARHAHEICLGKAAVSVLVFGQAEETLARLLWSDGRKKSEATRLARSALRKFENGGRAATGDLARLKKWMDERGVTR